MAISHNDPPLHLIRDQSASWYACKPDTSRKAYALTRLSFFPSSAGHQFEVGDEVQDVLPADVLKACIQRGDVSYDKPKAEK